MKKGWKTKPLAELCDLFSDGDWVESKDQSSEGIRLIQTGNVGDGVFKDRAEKARYISDATFKRLRCTEIFEGDCLISRLPDPVGRSCILPDTGERMVTAVDCTIVRFKRDTYLPKFFNLYSQSDEYLATVAKECTGTTRNRISRSNLGLTPIAVPPLSEQQRILGVLDEAFAGLATAQAHAAQNLQNARALFESHLQSVFTHRGTGWVEKTLGNVLVKTETTDPTRSPNTEFDYIDVSSVSNETLTIQETQRLRGKDAPGRARRFVRANDVLFATIRPTLRRIAIVPQDLDEQVCSTGYFVLRAKPEVDFRFIFYFLQTEVFMAAMEKLQKGASYPAVTDGDVRSQPIPVPPLTEQRELVAQLDALAAETQRLTRLYEQEQAALAALKKSLLHRAFTGEL
jgi:type I restriction enzyme S subunit